MDSEYITKRKALLQMEFDEGTKSIEELQMRQNRLQGAYAELEAIENLPKSKEKKESK